MFNTLKRMFRGEEATEILFGCIDGCTTGGVIMGIATLFIPIEWPFIGLAILWGMFCGSMGGCIGGIINAISGLLCW